MAARAQETPSSPAAPQAGSANQGAQTVADAAKSLPAMDDLLATAKARQAAVEDLRKTYTYVETETGDELDSHGNKKGTQSDAYQVWMVKGVTVRQHLAHNGQPLRPEEDKKEQDRVDKEVASIKDGSYKANKGNVSVSIATLLKVVTFSNERRVEINGRPTIVFDYRGNPEAKGGDLGLEIMKKLTGQVWLDEKDAALLRMQGTLAENFRVAGGLLVNVKAGSWFDLTTEQINGEIWFPQLLKAHVDGRILLFKGFNGEGRVTYGDYRKMKTSVTILAGSQRVDGDGHPIATPPVALEGQVTPATPGEPEQTPK